MDGSRRSPPPALPAPWTTAKRQRATQRRPDGTKSDSRWAKYRQNRLRPTGHPPAWLSRARDRHPAPGLPSSGSGLPALGIRERRRPLAPVIATKAMHAGIFLKLLERAAAVSPSLCSRNIYRSYSGPVELVGPLVVVEERTRVESVKLPCVAATSSRYTIGTMAASLAAIVSAARASFATRANWYRQFRYL